MTETTSPVQQSRWCPPPRPPATSSLCLRVRYGWRPGFVQPTELFDWKSISEHADTVVNALGTGQPHKPMDVCAAAERPACVGDRDSDDLGIGQHTLNADSRILALLQVQAIDLWTGKREQSTDAMGFVAGPVSWNRLEGRFDEEGAS